MCPLFLSETPAAVPALPLCWASHKFASGEIEFRGEVPVRLSTFNANQVLCMHFVIEVASCGRDAPGMPLAFVAHRRHVEDGLEPLTRPGVQRLHWHSAGIVGSLGCLECRLSASLIISCA